MFKPEDSLNKAMEINDPPLRQQTLHYLFTEISRSRNDKARQIAQEWLGNADLPVEWKQKWNP